MEPDDATVTYVTSLPGVECRARRRDQTRIVNPEMQLNRRFLPGIHCFSTRQFDHCAYLDLSIGAVELG